MKKLKQYSMALRRNETSSKEPDLFAFQDGPVESEEVSDRSRKNWKTQYDSTIGPPQSKERPMPDRLFVPLAKEPFSWFLKGQKLWELRRYGRQYTDAHIIPGRLVELRKGYSSRDSLWGKVGRIVKSKNLTSFFEIVPFKDVIPTASSENEAIEIAENILGVDDSVPLIGFEIQLGITRIPLAARYLPLVLAGRKTTTIRRGHRDYPVGPAVIFSSPGHVEIVITGVRFARLSELSEQDAFSDGFNSLAELRNALDTFYPKLKHDEPMTVVRFKLHDRFHQDQNFI